DDRLLAAAVTVRLATTGAGGTEPDPSCWQRRSRSRDAYTVRLGRGPHPWTPPLSIDASRTAPDVRALIDRAGLIPAAPIPLHLEAGRPIAIVGPTKPARAIARALILQATVLHGPADLEVAALSAYDLADAWTWLTWLPHTIGPGGSRLIGLDQTDQAAIVALLASTAATAATAATMRSEPSGAATPPGPRHIVLRDDPAGLAARRGPVRDVLRLGRDPDTNIVPIVIPGGGPVPAGV